MFTLLVPGIESGWPAAAPRLPALERLLARGRVRSLEAGPWNALARLAGGELAQWPVAPLSALAELSLEGQACLRVEPLGTGAEEQGLFRLPAAELGITRAEAAALATAFDALFAAEGVRLEIATPERWYLLIDALRWPSLQWRGFDGPAGSLAEGARPAPPEPALRLLLSEVEMLFHAHPVNEARRAQGAATIAGLHPWGGGRLGDAARHPARNLAADGAASPPGEPYLDGLRRLGVLAGAGFAWPVAVEDLGHASWEAVETNWAAPLFAALLRGKLDGIRIVTARAVHETSRFAALRFWRRPSPVHQLC